MTNQAILFLFFNPDLGYYQFGTALEKIQITF